MKFVVYRSQCISNPFAMEDLDILRTALAENARNNISGFLLRTKLHYFQYFEGAPFRVDQLEQKLKKDRRHREYVCLERGSTLHRKFPGWTMGYADQRSNPLNLLLTPHSDAPTVIETLLDVARREAKRLAY